MTARQRLRRIYLLRGSLGAILLATCLMLLSALADQITQ
jgi:hypothetical protein